MPLTALSELGWYLSVVTYEFIQWAGMIATVLGFAGAKVGATCFEA